LHTLGGDRTIGVNVERIMSTKKRMKSRGVRPGALAANGTAQESEAFKNRHPEHVEADSILAASAKSLRKGESRLARR
jgi:hypothetical protein